MARKKMKAANEAETLLLEKARLGDIADVSGLEDKTVRADFLRDLCVNPDDYEIHEKGVWLVGATITGTLSFEAANLPRPLGLICCTLENPLMLRDATTRTISLGSSILSGFEGDRLLVRGTMFLDDVTVTGETWLSGSHITGVLSCIGATFDNPDGNAFIAQRMTIGGRLFLEGMIRPKGKFDLTHARVGDLIDDESSWPDAESLMIDGFVYENLGSQATADERLDWLALMPKTLGDAPAYWPQPYEQVIKVFRKAGHDHDARKVAIAKQDCYREYLKRKAKHDPENPRYFRRGWLWLTRWLISYGYEPWRIFGFIAVVLILGSAFFLNAYHMGAVHPSKERIYIHENYVSAQADCEKSKGWHLVQPEGPKAKGMCIPDDYPAFNSFVYAVDTFFPIVDLHQESYWLPKAETPGQGIFRGLFWLYIAAGWFLTTIGVIGFTGLIKKGENSSD